MMYPETFGPSSNIPIVRSQIELGDINWTTSTIDPPRVDAEAFLAVLFEMLGEGATLNVRRDDGGWGAEITGVERPCAVKGLPSEVAAKDALTMELMRRSTARCCGGK